MSAPSRSGGRQGSRGYSVDRYTLISPPSWLKVPLPWRGSTFFRFEMSLHPCPRAPALTLLIVVPPNCYTGVKDLPVSLAAEAHSRPCWNGRAPIPGSSHGEIESRCPLLPIEFEQIVR